MSSPVMLQKLFEVPSDPGAEAPEPTTRWLTFSLLENRYAIEIDQIREILRPCEPTPVPGAPDWALGVINLRGAIVTVLSLHRLLGRSIPAATEAQRVLVTDVTGEPIGLTVDAVGDVWNAPDRLFEPAPRVADRSDALPVAGVFQRQGDPLLVLDVRAVLDLVGAAV